jgi:serine/threonine protein kinase/tetratricopeptide (TPR) repeat protein
MDTNESTRALGTGSLSAGDRLGKYEILGLAGSGGMGLVYRGLDTQLQRLVALKFLPEHLAASKPDKERFLREARTASSLDHANIGVIHAIEETADGRTYIVMAFYEGENLARKISCAPLPLGEAVNIAIQIAHGLNGAHSRAVIHRDIKPGNIILTQQCVVKIVDFGLARVSSSADSTQTLGTAGTIGYMSPEQTMGKPVDQRTDIWALGVVLAEMLTGRNLFQRDSAPATIMAILNEAPKLPDEIPLELRRIIYRALSKDAATRYPTSAEMLADLESFRGHVDPKAAQAVLPHPPARDAAFRESVAHASRPMWQPVTTRTQKSLWLLTSVIAVAILLVLLLLIPPIRNSIVGLFGRHEEHIAVLPFENVGSDPANEAISEGLMDSMSSRLTNLDVDQQSVWVVPTSEIRRLKIVDPASALRQLGATMVVKGSISREGSDIRLTLNLIDTKTLRQVGSAALEDRAGDLAALQDEAVSRLARLMHINVTAEMLRNTGGSVVPAAYEQYLKALGYVQRYDKPGNLDSAIAALNSAVKSDPRFALGFAQLGEAYRLKYLTDVTPKWLDEALANCQKAVVLDDHLPAVYVTLGRLHEAAGKHDLAVQEFQHALQLNNRDADALSGIAQSYENAGRIQDAETALKKAVALSPEFWNSYNNLALFYDRQNRYSESIAALRKAVELTPDNAQVYFNLGAVYIDTGDAKLTSDAEQALKKSIELAPSYPAYANLGQLYYTEKRYSESAAMTEKALQLNDQNYLVWNNLLNAYVQLNEKDKASAARTRVMQLAVRSAKLNPQDALPHVKLANLYARQNDREKAVARIQTALALSPDDPGVLDDVAVAYEILGERRLALKYIHQALQKGYPVQQVTSDPDMQRLVQDPSFRPKGK